MKVKTYKWTENFYILTPSHWESLWRFSSISTWACSTCRSHGLFFAPVALGVKSLFIFQDILQGAALGFVVDVVETGTVILLVSCIVTFMRLSAVLLLIDWAGITTGTVLLVFLDDSDLDWSNPCSNICPTRSVDDIIVGFTAGLTSFASTIGLGGCVVSGSNIGFTRGLTWFDSCVNLWGWDACGILILFESSSFLWVHLSGRVTVLSIIQNTIAVTFEDS